MRVLNEAVELVPVADLTLHPRNVNQGDLGAIHESVAVNGFYGTIVAQRSTGRVLVGNHRLMVAQQMGAKDVPVAWVDVDDATALRILLADNRTTRLGIDDPEQLVALLQEILADAGSLEGTGYDADALDELLADLGREMDKPEDPGAQVDRAAELQKKWGTERGQVWEIPSKAVPGKSHRVMCGDSTSAGDVGRLMGGESAEAVLTDPPYGISQPGVINDAPELLDGTVRGAVANLPVENAIVVAFQGTRTFPVWLDAIRAAGHQFHRMLWLYKAAQCTFPWRGWILTSESILVSEVGNGAWQDAHPYVHDCYYLPEVSGELGADAGWHGSVKPLSVVADITRRIASVGAVVFDPFLGSGTTMVATENERRVCYGIEISEGYCAVILERMAAMGLEPRKVKHG